MSQVYDVITRAIHDILAERPHKKPPRPLTPETTLGDTGLESLDIVVLATHLEVELGLDPFADLDAARYPKTIADLVRLYQSAPDV